MIYRLTTYHIPLTDFGTLRNEREDSAWPVLVRRGAVPLGLWRVLLGGRPGDVLELVRFDSLSHWADVTNDGLNDRSSWAPISEIALRPASRRHPGGEPQMVSHGSVWALRRFVPRPDQFSRFTELSEDHFWPLSQHDDRRVTLGQFHAHVAERDEILMLTHYESLAQWEETHAYGNSSCVSTPDVRLAANTALDERAHLLDDVGVRLLWPLSRRVPMRESCIENESGC